jgi:hypothetical protein
MRALGVNETRPFEWAGEVGGTAGSLSGQLPFIVVLTYETLFHEKASTTLRSPDGRVESAEMVFAQPVIAPRPLSELI